MARFASLLWRLRRATLIETGLFEIQGKIIQQRRRGRRAPADSGKHQLGILYRILREPHIPVPNPSFSPEAVEERSSPNPHLKKSAEHWRKSDAASVFLRLCHVNSGVIKRLERYDVALWRQVGQSLLLLEAASNRRIASNVMIPDIK